MTQAERAESSTSRKTRHPEPSAPACTAAVAMKTGWSLGPLDEVEILDVPGKPTFAELERAAAEERLVSDAILKKYHRLHRPWLDPSVPIEFGGRLGKSTYSWIRHGDEVFKVRHATSLASTDDTVNVDFVCPGRLASRWEITCSSRRTRTSTRKGCGALHVLDGECVCATRIFVWGRT